MRCDRRWWGLLFARKAVRKLAAVVSEQFDDGHRTGIFHLDQEFGTTAVRLIDIDLHEDLARCAINGDKQIPW